MVGRLLRVLRTGWGFLKVFLGVLMMGLLAVSWCTLVLWMFRGVLSVVVNLLSLGSLNEHSTAIFLGLLVMMMNSSAIFLDSAGLFWMMMKVLALSVSVSVVSILSLLTNSSVLF